jgi:hypothetical protein
VGGHGLRVFERATGLKIRGDAGGAEHVSAEPDFEPGIGYAADHPISIDTVHRLTGERAGSAAGSAEEAAFSIIANAGSSEVFVTKGFQLMMRRHLMTLAT